MTSNESRKPSASSRRYTPRPRRSDLLGPGRVRHELSGRRRLGQGELAYPPLVQDMARFWFFEAVRDVTPYVYETLKGHVFPAYDAFFKEATGATKPSQPAGEAAVIAALGRFAAFRRSLPGPAPTRALFDWAALVACESLFASLPPLRAWLEGWGSAYYLSDPWCLDVALCTLLQLEVNELMGLPEEQRVTRFVQPALRLAPFPPEVAALVREPEPSPVPGIRLLSLPADAPYNPLEETRAEAKLRLLPAVGPENIDTYLDRVGAQYAGAKRVRQRKEAHIRWLALYQCGDGTRSDMARWLYCDRSTVAALLKDLARLLDLTLRPTPLGRTPGLKDKGTRYRAR